MKKLCLLASLAMLSVFAMAFTATSDGNYTEDSQTHTIKSDDDQLARCGGRGGRGLFQRRGGRGMRGGGCSSCG